MRAFALWLASAALVAAFADAPAQAAPPPNDDFTHAVPLTGEQAQGAFTSADATLEPGEPQHAGKPGGRSVWFRLTVDDLSTWELHTCSPAPSVDTVLAVYKGDSVATLSEVASNHEYCGGSLVRVELNPGTYHVAVDDVGGVGGSFTLTWVRHRQRPRNISPPTIAGDPVEDNTLTASAGTWTSAAGPISYSYRWERCSGQICRDAGTGPTVVLGGHELGHSIKLQVMAANRDGSTWAESAFVGPVRVRMPVSRKRPLIEGARRVGSTLALVHDGTWQGSLLEFSYRWQRCRRGGTACSSIPGAVGPEYRIKPADLRKVIRVVVTGTNAAGTATAKSNAIGPISGRLCIVPRLRGKTVAAARKVLAAAGCSLGTVTRRQSSLPRGRVAKQSARPGKRLKPRARVGLVLSLGRNS